MTAVAFHKGKYIPLSDAKISIMTHAFHYGSAIFEGIRGNWNDREGKVFIFRLKEHYQRLLDGCRIMRINLPYSLDELCQITVNVIERSGFSEDVYIRPMAYKSAERVANLNLRDLEDDFLVFAIPFGRYLSDTPLLCCTSSWRRIDDVMIPPRVKVSGLYVNSIMAKTDAIASGFDEAILLNQDGHVSEGSGENIFIIKNGTLSTPGIQENVLPGITRDTIIQLARSELSTEVVERTVDRSELYLADEVFLTGTAAHISAVGEIDKRKIGDGQTGPVTRHLQEVYFRVVKGQYPNYLHMCTAATPRLVKA
jgi:branched-chain amino acid aminotransferase